MTLRWFDAHLDLAYLAVCGRDMTKQPAAAGGPDLPGCVTLPSLAAGNIRACLATVFTEMGGKNPASYSKGDAVAANRAGLAQLDVYDAWAKRSLVRVGLRHALASPTTSSPLALGILVECADPIPDPANLESWAARGVVAIGLAWAMGSRYAGGNKDGAGLTAIGRAMVKEVDRLKLVHDIAHLSDAALSEVFELAQGRLMASHSNCRALIDTPGSPPTQRHLTDATIREVTGRQGMIGLNLYSPFLAKGGVRDRRATITEAIDHVEHVCQVAGHRRCVGLGSDMDGGFSAHKLPEGINGPTDLPRLADELHRRNWTDTDIHAFAWGNWARFWRLPD